MILLSSKELVQKRLQEIEDELKKYKKKIQPKLVVVLVGEDSPSLIYIENKKKFCEKIGIQFELIQVESTVSEKNFLKILKKLNQDDQVHGLLLQLPLPHHLKHLPYLELIDPEKDVDGFHPKNLFKLYEGFDHGLIPCTPKGILSLLKFHSINIEEHVLIINRSFLVGKPLSLLLLAHDATITLAHSKSKNLGDLIKQSKIIVSALGIPHFFQADHFLPHHILIDVGLSKKNNQFYGDIDPKNLNVHAYTPVPGGVGPMTVLSLMENFLLIVRKLYAQIQ